MKTFKQLFNEILTGDKTMSRLAARQVRKLVYSSHGGKYEEIATILDKAPEEYVKIADSFRQENFVQAISGMYFLHNRENEPDFLFPWHFQLLQHENGNIRHAAVRMIEHEIGPLTYHIRFPGKGSGYTKITQENADQILFGLRVNLNNLAQSSWKPSYKKIKYVEKLPSGTYKSVQHILWELDDCCTDVSMPTITESTKEIIEYRKEIEQELIELLKETGSGFTLDHIKEIIFNEEGQDDLTNIIAMFDTGQEAAELSNILELVSDAWNYFPHKSLGGLSPKEKSLESKRLE
jgi:hypothetical protein